MQHWRAHRPWEEVDEGYHSGQTYKQVREIHCHEQRMLITPHTAEALAHWQVLLRNLLHHVLALVVGSTERRKKTATGFVKAEKCKEQRQL